MYTPTSDAAARLPEQFGRYRILRPLGQGGMGAVYLARDERLDRDVALKVCTLVENPKAQERFRREAKAAAALRHPNLCPLYDYDVQNGIAFITMAFIDGPSLNKWVAANPLDAGGAARLVRKLALAMQAAHEGGVIHRDLKPGNVAMDKKGEPVILDFGLARMVDARSQRTQQGAVLGTPTHMAPEQARGDTNAIGPATDVYALGVILYELLTGELPFIGPPHMVVAQVLAAAPRPPCKLNPDVPVELETICLKALAKKPEERFATMKSLADALTRVVRGLPARSQREVDAATRAAPMQVATAAGVVRQPTVSRQAPTLSTLHRPEWPKSRPPVALALVLLAFLAVVVWLGVHSYHKNSHVDPIDKTVTQVEPKKDMDRPDERGIATTKDAKDQEKVNGDIKKHDVKPPDPVVPQPDPIKPPDPVRPKPDPIVPPDSVRPKDQRTNSLGMTFVHLPKGTFYMGWDGETKGKQTKIEADFEIAIHTVTQEQWATLMDGENKYPSQHRRGGKYAKAVEKISDEELKHFPVENVSWDMTQEFIKKLNEKEAGSGWTYRLPTEAEWEYACRGGATSEDECSFHFYFDKPTNDLSSAQANFNSNLPFGKGQNGEPLARPTKVGSYPPNKLGLYDMQGNVEQWCSDLYRYYQGGSDRVIRGGGCVRVGSGCRAAVRIWHSPTYRSIFLGFRIARVPSVGK